MPRNRSKPLQTPTKGLAMNSTHDTHGYLFDKDLAANIVFAEATRFAAECSAHGPNEAEIQDVARKVSWLIGKDINWTELDTIIGYAFELRHLANGTHEFLELNGAYTVDNRDQVRSWITVPMFGEIEFMVAGVHTRWELAA